MKVTITPSTIEGKILAPTSKSSMQRACAAALLNEGLTVIRNPGCSNDDLAALGIIQNLGAEVIKQSDGSIQITGNGLKNNLQEATLDCGESGLSIRMFTPIAALSKDAIAISGSGSLLTRPMDFFDTIFPQLGITIQSNGGKLPLRIQGPLQPANICIDGSLSSQFLTGLLMAFAKAATSPVTITVNQLKSKPYIDLTLQVMKHFGYEVVNNQYESFLITPSAKHSVAINYNVEGDWSGAAFLLVAGATSGKISVTGLDVFSTQADKAILTALIDCGCNISIEATRVVVAPPATGLRDLKPFHFDATDCPDLFPPLVALAACCNGTTVIEGVSRLAHKESNRGLTLQQEFGKMGLTIVLQDDLMLVEGGAGLVGAIVESHHDHRIAMSCAIAALYATGQTVIEDADAINKSYPTFYEHLIQLGALITKEVSANIIL